MRERLHDAACLLLLPAAAGLEGAYREPHPELTFRAFALSLVARAGLSSSWRS